jgi:hypothetical protein
MATTRLGPMPDASADDRSEEGAQSESDPEARRFSVSDIRTSALILAAAVLLALGLLAHWVSNRGEDDKSGNPTDSAPTQSQGPSETRFPRPRPSGSDGIRTSPPIPSGPGVGGGLPGSIPSGAGQSGGLPVQRLVTAPASTCRSFNETRATLEAVTISVQNACQ